MINDKGKSDTMKKLITILLSIAALFLQAVGRGAAENDSGRVSDQVADPDTQQTIYFWDEGNMPSVTNYTVNNGSYADPPDFRPHMIFVPAAEGVPVKGAVMINPGGAFMYRSEAEGMPVAEALSSLGYQCFVVNYRLRPYTQEEGALDLARGIRFVRKNADVYGIDPEDIASIGFSAGGILSGETALNFDGTVNGTALDPDYVPDELDSVSADVSAAGMFYSFCGRLSVASMDVEALSQGGLPPTYFCYGSNEVFRSQIERHINVLGEAGGETLSRVIDMRPDLLAAYLHSASQWDGGYDSVVSRRMPVYIFMAENDEYYGAERAREPYNELHRRYLEAGLTEDEINDILVLDLRGNEYFNEHGIYNYHGGGALAVNDGGIIEWMLSHEK